MICDPETAWNELKSAVMTRHADVEPGRMMSADALTLHGKVFVFYSTKGGRVGLGARVGRNANIDAFEPTDWQHLAPFKTKPPMKDWIVVGLGDQALWSKVADHCYNLALKNT